MAIFTKEFLSGSTNGRPIQITTTASPGTLIHTAHATSVDEIYIYACNTSDKNKLLFIEFGGTLSSDLINVNIKRNAGLILVIPGSPLTNSTIVRAYAEDANVINIVGWVNRIT